MKYFALFTTLLFSSQALAETQRIENLKQLYESKDFQQAQEVINDILGIKKEQEINPDEENLLSQQEVQQINTDNSSIEEIVQQPEEIVQADEEEQLFAFFFNGLILIEQNEFAKAEESLLKILELKVDWEQISEVYYWLAQVSFLQKKFSQGIEFLKTIDQEKISQEEVDNIIQNFLSGEVDDIELNRCVCKNADNDFIVKKWLDRQVQSSFADQYMWLINHFLHDDKYKKYKKSFFNKVKIKKKGKYNLAVLLPLDLENSPKNSHSYDFYNLFFMALENLPDKDRFVIHFYDTKNGENRLNDVLDLKELRDMDIIINTSKKNLNEISQFSKDNAILLYDFSSKNLHSINGNDFAFLTQTSQETYNLGAAKLILDEIQKNQENQNITIVHLAEDNNAEIFINYLSFHHVKVNEVSLTQEELKNVLYKVRVNLNTIKKEKAKKLKAQKLLEEQKSSEEQNEVVEEVNKEEEKETEKLEIIKILEDSNYVFVSSPDIVLMGNVIGITEQLNISPKIFCDYDLLNTNLAEEIFNRENIFYLTSNDFGYDDVNFLDFKSKYFDQFKKYPTLKMFFHYNAFQNILGNILRNKIGVFHDKQKISVISF